MPSVWYYLLALALAKNPVVWVSGALYSVVRFLGLVFIQKTGQALVFLFLCVIKIVANRLPSLRKKRHTGLCTDCHVLDDVWNYNMVKQSAEYSPCAQTLALVFSYSFARIFVN